MVVSPSHTYQNSGGIKIFEFVGKLNEFGELHI